MKTGNKILWSGLLGIASLSLMAQPVQAKKVVSAKLQKQVVSVGNQTKVKTNNRKAVYSSSNSQVASINKLGVLTAKKAGTCNVYAVAANGRWADTGNRKITNEPKRSDRYERTKQKTHCTAVSDTAWRAVLHLAAVAGNCPGGG